MDSQLQKITDAYTEIFNVLNKHKDLCKIDINNLEIKSKYHLFGVELIEKYGFNIDPLIINSSDWNKLGEYRSICKWGKTYGRTIAWPDKGKQPHDELLLYIPFATGPYIFGDDYDSYKELFDQFFKELKTYNPKYVDTHNHSLYFSMDNASIIFNKFDSIINKYKDLAKELIKKSKIEKLKEELAKLEN